MTGKTKFLNRQPETDTSPSQLFGPEGQGDTVLRAAAKCLRSSIPFAVCHLPGEECLDFFCGLETHITDPSKYNPAVNKTFEIGPWLAPWADRISLGNRLTAESVANINGSGKSSFPGGLSTSPAVFHPDREISKEEYIAAVSAITGRCHARNGKTVYSRVISGENPSLDIPAAARKLFNTFPDSFGFLYYTPMTGCWLGATPETLLDFDLDTRRVSTMAFAGTRPASAGDTPWDDKNLLENQFVADYICDKFRLLGIDPEVSDPYTVRYGVIQHLRRDISATLPVHIGYPELLDLLNPTPAICGVPRDNALTDIKDFEPHTRGCYGGFVGISRNCPQNTAQEVGATDQHNGFKSFVNLRSARISLSPGHHFEILAGGGILSGSDPASEWAETEAKASRLLSILSSPNHNNPCI